ncbi:outer membrane protein assembly factor BamB family protein [Halorhabdus rudnickae]|uniref:outer membrane protein assembly factor BamB family protein n=1 Tax=Halorhabdus rudnickae TaxID=1775544 RepID=UPI0014386D27|nr:PQQ-binding-like beta-propeller repeat protein [Halorhabdus rudnickae]
MVRLSRRALLGGVGLLLGATSGCLEIPTRMEFSPADWPRPRSDPGQTNYSPTAGPVEAAEVAWSRSALVDPERVLLLADGTLYTTILPDLGDEWSLHGLDAETGETQFRVPRVDTLYSLAETTSYDNGVLLGNGHGLYGDAVLGINPDASPASRRWASTVLTPNYTTLDSTDYTVIDGTWYFCHGHDPAELVAVDVDDGTQRWHREFALDAVESPSVTAVGKRLVTSVSTDERSTMHVFDPEGGHLRTISLDHRWQRLMGTDGVVYAEVDPSPTRPTMGAYDIDEGEQLWQRQVAPTGYIRLHSAVGPDLMLVASRERTGGDDSSLAGGIRLHAFDRRSGDLRWEWSGSHDRFEHHGSAASLAIGGRTAYLIFAAGTVVAFSIEDGSVRWQTTVDGSVSGFVSQPIIGDRRLYFFIQYRGIFALEEP